MIELVLLSNITGLLCILYKMTRIAIKRFKFKSSCICQNDIIENNVDD